MLELIGSGKSDKGPARDRNEDRFHVDDELGLYVICDGMGGHRRGDFAADLVVSTVTKGVQEQATLFARAREGLLPSAEIAETLQRIVQQANRALHERGEGMPRHLRMGATLSLLLGLGDRALVADVGDSRIYHVHHGQAALLVRDDTLAQEVAEHSDLDVDVQHEQASQFSHVLTQALGIDSDVRVELRTVPLEAGDRFLLCTDGLSELLNAEDEAAIVARVEGELTTRPAALLEAARAHGSEDNCTAVVVEVAVGSGAR